MMKFVGFLCFWVAGAMLWAQDASIRGKVTDKATGRNIAGAKVFLLENGKMRKQTTSDAGGNYVLDSLPYGTFDLECNNPAYTSQRFVGLQLKRSSLRLAYFKMTYNPEQMGNKKKGAQDVELLYTFASLQAKQTAETSLGTSKGEQQLDVPNTGYLITKDEIQLRGYQYLFDVLEDIPEFEIQEKVNPEINNVIGSRGVSGSGRWVLMQDGIRINSLVGTDIVISQNITVQAAERIEIIIGPSSAVYGSDAFSGVINIVTQKGADLNGGQVQGSFGQYGTTDNTFLVGYGNREVSFTAHGNFYRSAEPYMPKYYPTEYGWYEQHYQNDNQVLMSPFSRLDTLTLSGTPEAYNISSLAFSFGGRLSYKNWDFGGMTNHESHSSAIGASYSYVIPAKSNIYSTSISHAYAKHNLKTEKLSLQSSLQWNQWQINPNSRFVNVYSSYQNAYKYGSENHFLLRENLDYTFNERHKISAGFSAQFGQTLAKTSDMLSPWERGTDFDQQTQYYIGSDFVTYTGDSLKIRQRIYEEYRWNTGLYIQYHANLFKDKLLLTVGNRLDYIHNRHPEDETTSAIHDYLTFAPRLGIVFKPNAYFRLKFSGSSGILTPPFQKTHAHYGSFSPHLDSAGHIVGLQANYWRLTTPDEDNTVAPESARALELSASYTRGDIVVSSNAYFNNLSNLFQTEIVQNTPFFEGDSSLLVPVAEISTATAYGYVYGGMTRIDYRTYFDKAHNIELRTGLSYSYVNGLIKDKNNQYPDKKPFYNAPHTIKANIMFRYKKYSTSIRLIYRTRTVNEGFGDGANFQQYGNQPFLLVNLYANGQVFETKNQRLRIDAFLRIRNLLDARYYHTGQPNASQLQAVPQDPIRIVGGFVFYFK